MIINHPDVRRMLLLQKAISEGSLSLVTLTSIYADLYQTVTDPEEDPEYPQLGVDEATIKLLTGGQVVDLDLSLTTSQGYLYIQENP